MIEKSKAALIRRFKNTEVLLHWMHAGPFLVLLITGWYLAWEAFEMQQREEWLSNTHKYVGIFLIILPPLTIIIGNSKLIFRNLKEILSFGKDDLGWMKAQAKKEHGPKMGKFNTGQKLNAIAAMSYSFALQATGIWLWVYPQGLLPRWTHTIIAGISMFILMGHIYMATLNPSTKKALRGIFTGLVPRAYMEEHHELQLEEIEKEQDS